MTTSNTKLKRLARARQAETGERYTTALDWARSRRPEVVMETHKKPSRFETLAAMQQGKKSEDEEAKAALIEQINVGLASLVPMMIQLPTGPEGGVHLPGPDGRNHLLSDERNNPVCSYTEHEIGGLLSFWRRSPADRWTQDSLIIVEDHRLLESDGMSMRMSQLRRVKRKIDFLLSPHSDGNDHSPAEIHSNFSSAASLCRDVPVAIGVVQLDPNEAKVLELIVSVPTWAKRLVIDGTLIDELEVTGLKFNGMRVIHDEINALAFSRSSKESPDLLFHLIMPGQKISLELLNRGKSRCVAGGVVVSDEMSQALADEIWKRAISTISRLGAEGELGQEDDS